VNAREAARRYAQTEHGKAKRAEYQRSMTRKQQIDAYRASPEGRAAARRANQSAAGKDRQTRYFRTEKGKAATARKHAKRRTALASVEATLTAEEWAAIIEAAQGRCAYCQKTVPLTMDHVIPLSKGGPHTKENVVPACRPCNARKKDRVVGATFGRSGM
jgi:5-methylcytosine-specific restriction endonuclease McrA